MDSPGIHQSPFLPPPPSTLESLAGLGFKEGKPRRRHRTEPAQRVIWYNNASRKKRFYNHRALEKEQERAPPQGEEGFQDDGDGNIHWGKKNPDATITIWEARPCGSCLSPEVPFGLILLQEPHCYHAIPSFSPFSSPFPSSPSNKSLVVFFRGRYHLTTVIRCILPYPPSPKSRVRPPPPALVFLFAHLF